MSSDLRYIEFDAPSIFKRYIDEDGYASLELSPNAVPWRVEESVSAYVGKLSIVVTGVGGEMMKSLSFKDLHSVLESPRSQPLLQLYHDTFGDNKDELMTLYIMEANKDPKCVLLGFRSRPGYHRFLFALYGNWNNYMENALPLFEEEAKTTTLPSASSSLLPHRSAPVALGEHTMAATVVRPSAYDLEQSAAAKNELYYDKSQLMQRTRAEKQGANNPPSTLSSSASPQWKEGSSSRSPQRSRLDAGIMPNTALDQEEVNKVRAALAAHCLKRSNQALYRPPPQQHPQQNHPLYPPQHPAAPSSVTATAPARRGNMLMKCIKCGQTMDIAERGTHQALCIG